jgi:hypothetical protein
VYTKVTNPEFEEGGEWFGFIAISANESSLLQKGKLEELKGEVIFYVLPLSYLIYL